jgi:hypothetical protein
MLRILRGLGSRALPCGCLVGVYETYATQTIAIIDAKGSYCTHKTHRVDAAVDFSMAASTDLAQPPSTMPIVNR